MAKAEKTLPPQDPLTAGRRALHKRRNAAQDRRDALGLLGRVVVLAAAAWVLFTQVFLLTQASGNSMFPAVKDGDLLNPVNPDRARRYMEQVERARA